VSWKIGLAKERGQGGIECERLKELSSRGSDVSIASRG